MFKKFFIVSVLVIAASAHVRAQAPKAAELVPIKISPSCKMTKDIRSQALNLADVVELALCNNPTTRAAWLNMRISDMAFNSATSSYLPTVNANFGVQRDGGTMLLGTVLFPIPPGTNTTTGLNASWLLFDFGTREASIAQAYYTMNSTEFQYNATLQQVANDAIVAYYQVFLLGESLNAAKMNEQATEKSFELASKKFQLGMNSRADMLQAETAYMQAQLDTTRQEQQLRNSRAQLADMLGLPPALEFKLAEASTEVSAHIISAGIDDLIKIAHARRPDLQAQLAQVKAARAAYARAGTAFLPSISANANKTWIEYEDQFHRNGPNNWSVSVRATVPIFTGFERVYQLRSAGYEYDRAKENLRQMEQSVELSIVSAHIDYQTSLKSLELANKMYESAIENEAVASGSYQAGRGDIIRLMEAQSRLISARQEQIAAKYGVQMNKIALLRAAGELNMQNLDLNANPAR